MGMDAELYAIGKFSKKIVSYLQYPSRFYDDIPEGAEIITYVCGCSNSDGSRSLAQALGIEPWAFEQHCNIPNNLVDLQLMRESIENEDNVDNFIALRDAGFKFYYLPNG